MEGLKTITADKRFYFLIKRIFKILHTPYEKENEEWREGERNVRKEKRMSGKTRKWWEREGQ